MNWCYLEKEVLENRKDHYCHVLSKIDEEMLKRVLLNFGGDLFRIFLDNLLYKDYCLHLLDLLEKYAIKLDLENFGDEYYNFFMDTKDKYVFCSNNHFEAREKQPLYFITHLYIIRDGHFEFKM